MFCRSLFILQFKDSDYPFGIFNYTLISEATTVLISRGRPKQNICVKYRIQHICVKHRICFTILLLTNVWPVNISVISWRSVLLVVFYIVVCPFVLFLLVIVLSVLRFMDSDYPFCIFKLFLYLGESCLETGATTTPKICTDIHSVPMIITIQIQNGRSSRTKVITRK